MGLSVIRMRAILGDNEFERFGLDVDKGVHREELITVCHNLIVALDNDIHHLDDISVMAGQTGIADNLHRLNHIS